MVGLAIAAQSQGLLIGAIFMNHMAVAVFLCPISCIPLVLFCGFLVRITTMPWFVRPLSYHSYLKYAFEGALLTIYGFDRCEYDYELAANATTEKPEWFGIMRSVMLPQRSDNYTLLHDYQMTSGSHVAKLLDTISNELDSPITSPHNYESIILSQYDIEETTMIVDIIGLAIAFLVLRILAYLVLLAKVNQKE